MIKVKQNGLATHSNLRAILVPDSKVHGAYMGPPGADRTQLGPMLAPWSLLSGVLQVYVTLTYICKFHILVSIQNILGDTRIEQTWCETLLYNCPSEPALQNAVK